MNQKDVEVRLSTAIDHAVPDVLESILAQCNKDVDNTDKPAVIDIADIQEKKKTKRKNWQRRLIAIAAALALVFLGTLGYGGIQQAQAAVTTVSLDAGANIDLELNRNGRVVSVSGEGITDELRGVLKGKNMDQAATEVVDHMVSSGSISAESNSLLISVSGENAAELEAHITQLVDNVLSDLGIDGAIVAQQITEYISELSEEMGIPAGRAELIEKLADSIEGSNRLELSKLSINELNFLMSSSVGKLEGVVTTGSANSSAYVSADSALANAYAHAGISEDGATAGAAIDTAAGRLSYEIEFSSDGVKYEYSIDAKSGKVIGWVSEVIGGVVEDVIDEAIDHIDEVTGLSLDEAKKRAIEISGIDPSLIGDFDIKVSAEGQCSVSFKVGDMEYSYDLDSKTGDVVKVLGGIADFFKNWG